VSETDVLEPISLYGVTKAAGTLLTIQQSKVLGLPAAVLRLFGIYGPYDREDKFVPRVIRACLAETPIDLTRGEQVRDYIFIGDAVQAFVSLVKTERFPAGEIVNLAGGAPYSIKRIGETAAKFLNGNGLLRWGVQPYRPDEMKTLLARTDKAKRLLAWSASTSMEEGLKQTVQWYERQATGNCFDGQQL
jgi:nucleoside-diphosphate-sugar epimerase